MARRESSFAWPFRELIWGWLSIVGQTFCPSMVGQAYGIHVQANGKLVSRFAILVKNCPMTSCCF
jgi:hypothetical protein